MGATDGFAARQLEASAEGLLVLLGMLIDTSKDMDLPQQSDTTPAAWATRSAGEHTAGVQGSATSVTSQK